MAVEAKEEKKVTLLNRSKRHFDLKGQRLSPNESAAVGASEAENLLKMFPRELFDVAKLAKTPSADAEAKKLEAENVALADENAKLKEQLAALEGEKSKKGKDK